MNWESKLSTPIISEENRVKSYQTISFITAKTRNTKITNINIINNQASKEISLNEINHAQMNQEIYKDYTPVWETYIQNEKVLTAIKNTTDHQQRILWLVFVISYKQKEVAQMLSVSEAAVSKSKKLGLAKIKRILEN